MKPRLKMLLVVSLLANLAIVYVGYKAWTYRSNINYWLNRYNHAVAEFSKRDVHADSNADLSNPNQDKKRVVFFGTQVTSNWPIEELFPSYETIDRGADSQWVAGYLLRFRSDVIELEPAAVVIEISSYNFRPNQSSQEIREYTMSMIDLAVANGIVPIPATIIPPTQDYSVYELPDFAVKDTVLAFSAWLTDYAQQRNLEVADFRAAVADETGFLRADYAVGQVDLNRAGYEAISVDVGRILEGLE